MKKRIQSYSIVLSVAAGAVLSSAGHAQEAQIKSQINATPISESHQTITPISQSQIRTASWQGQKVALRGRDVVSFHQSDTSLKGKKEYSAKWDSTTWRFASAQNRDLFLKNPERYTPEFGGYCPVALADNDAKVGLTRHYTVIDEKLYLNFNRQARKNFRETPKEYIVRAQLNF